MYISNKFEYIFVCILYNCVFLRTLNWFYKMSKTRLMETDINLGKPGIGIMILKEKSTRNNCFSGHIFCWRFLPEFYIIKKTQNCFLVLLTSTNINRLTFCASMPMMWFCIDAIRVPLTKHQNTVIFGMLLSASTLATSVLTMLLLWLRCNSLRSLHAPVEVGVAA